MKLKKNIATLLLLCTVTLGLALSGCSGGGGSQGTATSTPVSDPALSGTAMADSLVAGTVTLKDSSVPVQARKTTISSDGTYTFITTGLVGPYILKAEWSDSTGTNKMYSMATDQPGNVQARSDSYSSYGWKTNINQFSDAAMYDASDGNPDYLFDNPDPSRYQTTASNLDSVISSLSTVLAPLFSLYNISGNPVSDANEDALRKMFQDVKFVVSSGIVTVTNRQTGGVIFTGPTNNIASGTFYPENMPGGTGSSGSTSCSYTYSAWGTCQSDNTQSRTTLTSSPAGCTGTPVLSQSCTYVPPACTYNYSAWGACQPNGTQTRTAISSPAGCIGTPAALSQSCTYVPPVTACTSFTYSAWGACQTNNTQTRTIATSSPAGCTGGTPILSQTCTYVPPACTYTYDAWGACQSNGTQTRNVLTTSPAGCTGTPVTSQACTYVPPTCTSFTYSAWSACQSNNTQTRTIATSSPAGCTGGTPVLSQSCVYVPPVTTITSANVTTSCTGCHGLTVNGNVFKSGGYTVTGRTAANWLTTINNMIGYGATLTPAGATAQDYANFLATLPTPAPVTCTSFTYSAWGTCQSNNTQTRTVLTSSPTGCTGGTPVLSQSCTYVPPVTTCTSFTYSAWGACQSNNTQTRTIVTSSPTGCTGGTPVLSQSCTYVPPTPTITNANVTSSCTGCHGLTVNTTVFRTGGYTVTGRSAANWLTTVNNMIGYGASLTPAGVTAQDYANFLATVP